jgi:O-antigen/teichoic acid export membrane protein
LVIKTGIQILYFIIIAQALKPDNYGAFSGALAYVLIFSPFSSWGSGQILIKNVAVDSTKFSKYWGMAVGISLVSALFFFVLSALISTKVFSIEIVTHVILPLTLGDFLGEKFLQLSSYAFLAHQKMAISSILNITSAIYRLISAIILLALPIEKNAENWASFYMISSLLSGLTGILFVKWYFGWGPINISNLKEKWKEGFFFSVGISAQGAYNDLDKILMLRLGPATEAGVYAIAYRIIDAAFMPIRAILTTAYPHFFKEGNKGIKSLYSFSLRLLSWTVGASLIVSIGIVLLSPLVPYILGKQYVTVALIIVWLSPLIILRSFYFTAADAITGGGSQSHRSGIQIGIAMLNSLLNLAGLPPYGWKGAVYSSLISDLFSTTLLWGILYTKKWSSQK